MYMPIRNPSLAWNSQKCVEVKPVNGIQTLHPVHHLITNAHVDTCYIKKHYKPTHICLKENECYSFFFTFINNAYLRIERD